jgi:hypothetical protein
MGIRFVENPLIQGDCCHLPHYTSFYSRDPCCFHDALLNQEVEIVKETLDIIKDQRLDINNIVCKGEETELTAIDHAMCDWGSEEGEADCLRIVEMLLDAGAELRGEDAFHCCYMHSTKGFEIMQRHGIDLSHVRDSRGSTLLHRASTIQAARYLLNHTELRLCLNEQNSARMTPLDAVIADDMRDVAQYLIRHNAQANIYPDLVAEYFNM